MIQNILISIREKMKERGLAAYVVPMGDYHGSEYISDYFREIRFISGFSGSAATVVIMENGAWLWTDGRYFLQAEKELAGTGIELMRMREPGVPTLAEFLSERLPERSAVGFDGRIVTAATAEGWWKALTAKRIRFCLDADLAGELWEERPNIEFHPCFLLPQEICGETASDKLARVRAAMKKAGADCHILSSLDDIAWLFNIRGADVPCNPVLFSFLLLRPDGGIWFVTEDCLPAEVKTQAAALGLELRPYEEIWEAVKTLTGCRVLADKSKVSVALTEGLPEDAILIPGVNPTTEMKCIKNAAEQQALAISHHKDGVAMVKFLYWLEQFKEEDGLSEWDVAEKLRKCREAQGAFDLSFDTIAAMGPNASVVHYEPTAENHSLMKKKGLFLLDSGGQYLEGTTDITRTIAMGELTEAEKLHYTAVLRGNLRLGACRFRYGCAGQSLDVLARGPLWDMGEDYNHGTGHGVGFCLNVHEGPNNINYHLGAERPITVLEPGMVTTDEPGFYEDNAYGIRIENELLCVECGTNRFGRFLGFEVLTRCPIDLRPVLTEKLTQEEKAFLNRYHEQVYQELKAELTEEEERWLYSVTRPV